MTAGMVMANGTGIPAVSRPRNTIVTTRTWSSGPIASPIGASERPQTPDIGGHRAHERDAQRRHADHEQRPRDPERRLQERRSAVAEPQGRAHEAYKLPDEDGAEDQSHQLEEDRRNELPTQREARQHELDAMEGTIDVGDRQAQEGNGD